MDQEDQQPVLDTSYHDYSSNQFYVAPSSSSSAASYVIPTVLDYVPSVISEGAVDTKCLVVLKDSVPAQTPWRQHCMFRLACQQAYCLVALDWAADNVLRCLLPALRSGVWSVTIVDNKNVRKLVWLTNTMSLF